MTESARVDKEAAEWSAALWGDRDAFRAMMSPYLREVFNVAHRELHYRVALGDLDRDDPMPEELVGDVLARAWQDRQRRPLGVGLKAWLLAVLFRVVAMHVRDQARFKALSGVSLERPVPPEPIYDDDESIWEWYQPTELTRAEDVGGDTTPTRETAASADEELVRTLDPRTRELFLMTELHGVPLPEAAAALGTSLRDAARLLDEARRNVGAVVAREAPS